MDLKGRDCVVVEGSAGMIEYSQGAPDQSLFKSSSDVPVHPQPIAYMEPPVDDQIPNVDYLCDYYPLDFDMFVVDDGPVATPPFLSDVSELETPPPPLMCSALDTCDPFDVGPSWEYN